MEVMMMMMMMTSEDRDRFYDWFPCGSLRFIDEPTKPLKIHCIHFALSKLWANDCDTRKHICIIHGRICSIITKKRWQVKSDTNTVLGYFWLGIESNYNMFVCLTITR